MVFLAYDKMGFHLYCIWFLCSIFNKPDGLWRPCCQKYSENTPSTLQLLSQKSRTLIILSPQLFCLSPIIKHFPHTFNCFLLNAGSQIFRTRFGGSVNIRGILVQMLYSVYRAFDMCLNNGPTELQLEGIEDLDIGDKGCKQQ